MALTAWQQGIYDSAKRNNQTIADLLARPGWGDKGIKPSQIETVLTNAGLDLPMTRAPEQTKLAQDALDAGTTKPLTEWQTTTLNNAIAAGESTDDLAERWKHLGVSKQQIDTILLAALPPTSPYRVGNAGVPTTVNNQGSDPNYPGGLPMQQPGGGGMYGPTRRDEVPRMVLGQVPQLPGLRMVRQNARQREQAGWRGQTDTILTSGRGVTDPANTQVKTLLGS